MRRQYELEDADLVINKKVWTKKTNASNAAIGDLIEVAPSGHVWIASSIDLRDWVNGTGWTPKAAAENLLRVLHDQGSRSVGEGQAPLRLCGIEDAVVDRDGECVTAIRFDLVPLDGAYTECGTGDFTSKGGAA